MDTLAMFYKVVERLIVRGLYLMMRRLCDTNSAKTIPYHHYKIDVKFIHKLVFISRNESCVTHIFPRSDPTITVGQIED